MTNGTRHIVESQQFKRPLLEKLFDRAVEMREQTKREGKNAFKDLFPGMEFMPFFDEESTRTRLSFDKAAHRLGFSMDPVANGRFSSSYAKGEPIEDEVLVLGQLESDVIVLRHKENDAAERAAAVSSVPIINGGSGSSQHPTQSALDCMTIRDELGAIDGQTIVIVGYLKDNRTPRSLAYLCGKYEPKELVFVSPPEVAMGDDITAYLKRHETPYQETTELMDALPHADVVYVVRTQDERIEDEELRNQLKLVAPNYSIGLPQLERMSEDAILMHPLPRKEELKRECDDDRRAIYLSKMVHNGLYMRMALIEWVLSG